MFSDTISELIKEDLVLTKLTNTVFLKRYENEYFVAIQGILVPYNIFLIVLCSRGLWKIPYSKSDWYKINRTLIKLWKELDIVSTDVEFNIELSPKEAAKRNKIAKKRIPLSVVEDTLKTLEVDPTYIRFFSNRHPATQKFEYLLYYLESEHEKLDK